MALTEVFAFGVGVAMHTVPGNVPVAASVVACMAFMGARPYRGKEKPAGLLQRACRCVLSIAEKRAGGHTIITLVPDLPAPYILARVESVGLVGLLFIEVARAKGAHLAKSGFCLLAICCKI